MFSQAISYLITSNRIPDKNKVGQGPTALVVGADGGCLDVFTLIYPFLFSFSLSLGDGPI